MKPDTDVRRFPVTHVQEERFRSGGGRHFAFSGGLTFTGDCDYLALVSALHRLLRRHPYLRAVFGAQQDGSVVSRLTDIGPEFLTECAVSPEIPESERQRVALEVVLEHRRTPFDLQRGPLFRAILLRVDASCTILDFTMDHILADGLSRVLLLRDLVELYREAVTGEPGNLPTLEKSFPEFCAQERAYLSGETLRGISRAWAERLRGVDPIPDSRLSDGEAPGGSAAVGIAYRSLGPEGKTRADRQCRAAGVSPAVLSSAAVAFAMRTMRAAAGDSQADDIAFMASVANRAGRQWRDVCGYFATPNVLRTDLAGARSVGDVLLRQRATMLHALRYQRMPHSLLITQLKPSLYGLRHVANADAAPRYVNFDHVQRPQQPRGPVAGATVTPFRHAVPSVPRGGLRIVAREQPDDLVVHIEYRADRYGHAWIARFADALQAFLVAAGDDSRTPVRNLTYDWVAR